jgi:2-polyprenyl-6-methoxyphenol hydroxylase-like FAD-dependent oxidoreductase
MTLPETVDILVVGAGPSGLALALTLSRMGLKPLVIDRLPAQANTSRAGVIHARTLETLAPLGVVPTLIDEGLRLHDFRVRSPDRELLHIDFSHIPSPYPFVLMCPQDRTEAVLLAALEEAGGAVHRPAELTGLEIRAGKIVAEIRRGDRSFHVTAAWVVGCDGMHSTVRELAGIGFAGERYAENFVLADLRMDWLPGREEVGLYLADAGLMVVAPLPGERFRIVATVPDAPPEPDAAFIEALVAERGPAATPGTVREVLWSSRFHVHHRLAETALRGRVLLCGDAAHVHSPAGGQGMNIGIQDAVTLAEPLARALQADDTEGLRFWAEARHAVAETIVAQTDRLTRMGTLTSLPARLARNAALALIGHLPGARARIARTVAELDLR